MERSEEIDQSVIAVVDPSVHTTSFPPLDSPSPSTSTYAENNTHPSLASPVVGKAFSITECCVEETEDLGKRREGNAPIVIPSTSEEVRSRIGTLENIEVYTKLQYMHLTVFPFHFFPFLYSLFSPLSSPILSFSHYKIHDN